MIFDQAEFDVRCEWGRQGVDQLAAILNVSDTVPQLIDSAFCVV
ncbi:MAG: hypothetical protein AAFO04_07325 [Cyanobacteria bacterium J06592_8]